MSAEERAIVDALLEVIYQERAGLEHPQAQETISRAREVQETVSLLGVLLYCYVDPLIEECAEDREQAAGHEQGAEGDQESDR